MGAGGPAVYSGHIGTGGYSVGTWGQSVTVGAGGSQGVQLLTVGTWAGCPADSGYIRAGGSS